MITRRSTGIARWPWVTAIVAVVLMLPAEAQKKKKESEEKFRTVSGFVTDTGDKPVTGAVVQLKNTKTLQVRSYITKEDGSYFFSGLDPDIDYTLKADHQGAASSQRTLSSFDARKKPVVNLKIEKK